MSLHLLESRKATAATARKRGGTVASIVVHIVLITSAVTLATAAPVPTKHVKEEPTIFIAPKPVPPPIRTPATTTQAPSTPSSAPQLPQLPQFPVDIPTTIPEINYAASSDVTLITGRTGTGVADGLAPTGPGGGGVAAGSVLTDVQVDKPVALMAGMRAPRYPDALRSAGVQDTVLATFVVDTAGHVEPESFQALNTPNALFVASVRLSLQSARFKPAEVAGHPVRQRVNQAFVFTLVR